MLYLLKLLKIVPFGGRAEGKLSLTSPSDVPEIRNRRLGSVWPSTEQNQRSAIGKVLVRPQVNGMSEPRKYPIDSPLEASTKPWFVPLAYERCATFQSLPTPSVWQSDGIW